MRIKLDTVSNVLVILSFPILAWLGYSRITAPPLTAPGMIGPQLKAGEHVGAPAVSRADCKVKLLFFLSSHCKYCQADSDFYRTLAEQFRSTACSVGLFPKEDLERTEFLSKNRLQFDRVADFQSSTYKVRGTPTLVVLSSDDKLITQSMGALNNTRRDALVAQIRSSTH